MDINFFMCSALYFFIYLYHVIVNVNLLSSEKWNSLKMNEIILHYKNKPKKNPYLF